MKRRKGVTIVLTEKQIEQLAGLQKKVMDEYAIGTWGMIIAQVFPGVGTMRVVFIEHDTSMKLFELINGEPYKGSISIG